MLLHLLRHADAGDPEAWQGPDSLRPLSAKGRRQSKRLGDHLAAIGFTTDVIVTSPKIRAEQTADIVGERLKVRVTVDDRLGGGFDIETLDELLTDAGDPDRIVLVGHDPDFSETLSTLCGPRLEMKKGAFARIEVERPLRAGRGTLRWLLPPDALKDH
ncbi:MAG TPA: histidine phosphatase family protein [Candidatus Limnocylindrales bacterium]|nr:histidine phosphatase family protein [Candidatus Limnocylindrales bacterium]